MMAPFVGLGLIAWFACLTLLVRRAERSVTIAAALAPWPTLACACAVIACGLVVRPLAEATICSCACIGLIAASGPDVRTGYLFDAITLPTAVLVSALAIAHGAAGDAAAGVALLVGAFGTVVVVSRGRLMGLGDVKAMYAIGAAFGPLESLVAIFAACLSGIIVALASARFARDSEIRFGPHLAAGSAIALVAGPPIVHRVMGA